MKDYDYNKEIYKAASVRFIAELMAIDAVKSDQPSTAIFSVLRGQEVITSCTTDIKRYCEYHQIDVCEGKSGVYDLSNATRASFFIKWVLNFRPIMIDNYFDDATLSKQLLYAFDSETKYPQEHIDTRLKTNPATYQFFCNEIFALHVASVALKVNDKRNNPKCIIDIVGDEELRSIYYALRYRIKHQDSYTLWLNALHFPKTLSKTLPKKRK
jgi:hypothetical protein